MAGKHHPRGLTLIELRRLRPQDVGIRADAKRMLQLRKATDGGRLFPAKRVANHVGSWPKAQPGRPLLDRHIALYIREMGIDGERWRGTGGARPER